MPLITARFMLFLAGFDYALAVLGENQEWRADAKCSEIYWENEVVRLELFRRCQEPI